MLYKNFYTTCSSQIKKLKNFEELKSIDFSKVNSKSNILEFKRKHNLLVDGSSVKISASNITTLSDEDLNNLKCGDMVQKKTGNQFHNYIVTYKEENHGICLSYYACGYTETVSYDFTEGHWVYNSTDISLCNSLEEIKDANGNNRFIEGDIQLNPGSEVDAIFAKWSLSGSHLLIVVLLNCENTKSIGGQLCIINLPSWIKNKIVDIAGTSVVDTYSQSFRANDNTIQQVWTALYKQGDVISINTGSLTFDKDRQGRIAFDLLID